MVAVFTCKCCRALVQDPSLSVEMESRSITVPRDAEGKLGLAFTGPDADDFSKRRGVFVHMLRPGGTADLQVPKQRSALNSIVA